MSTIKCWHILNKQEKHKKVLGRRMNNKLWAKNYFINGIYEYEEWNNEREKNGIF